MSQKTVRVRIAVAVDEDGNWNTYGWGASDGELGSTVSAQREMAEDGLPGINKAHHTVWVEAVVPLPLPTIEGKAVPP